MDDKEMLQILERDYAAMVAANPDLEFSLFEFLRSRKFSTRTLNKYGYYKHGGRREGAGRKSLPSTRRKIRRTVTLAPNDVKFLKNIDPNLSKAIRSLVESRH